MKSCPIKTASGCKPFDKKNAIAFGKTLYSQNKNGDTFFVKLCEGYLITPDSKNNDGETIRQKKLHCAVGEAYYRFVSNDMRSVKAIDASLFKGPVRHYYSKWDIDQDGSTAMAIDALVKKAILKKLSEDTKQDLAKALGACVTANDSSYDDGCSLDDEIYRQRAENVATVWQQQVVPLLK